MDYLLDTCVITDFIKQRGNTVKKIVSSSRMQLSISSITISEISYGLKKIEGSKKHKEIIRASNELMNQIKIINIDEKIAKEAGHIRYELASKGIIIGQHDILIGATARYHDLIMVTSNIGEFERIAGILVENWRGA